ncbi:MAG: phosphoesterase family protein [Solirubrobacterales bacterium]|nr:phosphoesterase family protein [Solirubrobacterales bacterium]
MSAERADPCRHCGSLLDCAQRYCLGCGARIGGRGPLLDELQGRIKERSRREDASLGLGIAAVGASPRRTGAPARLPGPRVAALLVVTSLGFGAILGGAAGSQVNGSLAASARRLKVVVPKATASAGSTSTAPAAPAPETQPPEAEASPTPAPSRAPGTAAAKAPSAAGAPSGAVAPGAGERSASRPAPGSPSTLPPVKHVFVIMLSDQPYAAVFGPASAAPYLSRSLERRGELLVRYDAVAHEQLANELALISGQGPTAQTAANCPSYTDVATTAVGTDEQLVGNGCVYPSATQTLPGQLSAKHLSWRAYVGGLGEAGAPSGSCPHPAPGALDPTAAQALSGYSYATFRDPFVYFHSIIDSPACVAGVVGLDRLKGDLSDPARTPSLSYIAPDGCHNGSPAACAPGAPAGLAPADSFLKTVVPEILRSSSYRTGGLLVITVDEAPSSGELADSSSCCGQPQYPNLGAPATGLSPRGGGTVGALLLSPFIKGATTSQQPFNHFSLLRTIEDLFKIKHLGYAARAGVTSFEPSMFTVAPKG